MSVFESVSGYVSGEIGLDDLFAELHLMTWPGVGDMDEYWALAARAILSEATTADWPEEAIRSRLELLIRRLDLAISSYNANLREIDTYEAPQGIMALAILNERRAVDTEDLSPALT